MPIQLSERQQATVASAVTILAAVIILMAVAALFWLIGAFCARFSTVLLPLAEAGVAALVFRPYYEWLRRRLRLPKGLALTAVFLSVLIPLDAFLFFFGALAVDQISDLVAKLPYLEVAGQGTLNMVTRGVDYQLDVKLVRNPQLDEGLRQYLGYGLPVVVGGTFSEPRLDLGGSTAALAKQVAEQKVDELKEDLEDQVKNKLKDLLGGG